jgi:lipopolysaccharide/colanic/teichoic acid biosynthesis glycosyltransferase
MTSALPVPAPRAHAEPAPIRSPTRGELLCKRAFDVSVGLLLALVAAPLLLALALGARCRCGSPVFFSQRRDVGRGRTAQVLKLRTLRPREDPDTRWAVRQEEATAFGHWLRVTHLDELPQLANVLRGEMSLIGPRPERPYFVEQFSRELPGYPGRHRLPAGMTGWAQVHGLHGDTSIAERARYDNDYIDHWSLRLDAVILARTLRVTLRGLVRPACARGGTG